MPCRFNFPCHAIFPNTSGPQGEPGCSWFSRKNQDLLLYQMAGASDCEQGQVFSPLVAVLVPVMQGNPGNHEGIWRCGAGGDWKIGGRAVGVRGADSYLEEFNIHIPCGNCIQMRGSVHPSLQQLIKLSRKRERVPITPPTFYKSGLCHSK